MKLPFAVYTAREGYAWQSGTESGTGKLERLRRAIGKMPEFDFGEPASSGILNVGEEIVLYRFMRAEKADSKGRDATYLALTYFSRSQARFLNAEGVLGAYPFAEPLVQPPSEFEYGGAAALPTDFEVPGQAGAGQFDPGGSLAAAGFVFSHPFTGTLHVIRQDPPARGKGVEYRYQPARAAEGMIPAVEAAVSCADSERHTANRVSRSSAWKWVAVAALVVALAEAVLLAWILVKGPLHGRWHPAAEATAADSEPQQTEAATEPDAVPEEPVPADLPEPEPPQAEITPEPVDSQEDSSSAPAPVEEPLPPTEVPELHGAPNVTLPGEPAHE